MTRLTIDALGVKGFGLFALIVGVTALLPFADLGVGAAVTDIVARSKSTPLDVATIVCSSLRLLLLTATTITVCGWALTGAGWWGSILGVSDTATNGIAAGVALTAFAATVPLSLAFRLLLGAERNHIALLFQGIGSLVAVAMVAIAARMNAPLWAFAAAPPTGLAMAALAAVPLALSSAGLRLRDIKAGLLSKGNTRGRVLPFAAPMFVMTIAQPLAYQSDRLVLSHVTSLEQVAEYAAVLQLFAPLLSLIASAGISLWPIFARKRDAGLLQKIEFSRISFGFLAVGGLFGTTLFVTGKPITTAMTGGRIGVSFELLGAFALLLILQALYYPIGMILTDPRGLRFQAVTSVVMMFVNLALSWWLALAFGAPGPVLGSLFATLIVMVVPGWLLVSRLYVQ